MLDLIIRTGTQVKHGSPNLENIEIIESINEELDYLKIQFESGCFTYINSDDFLKLKKDGEVIYNRARGFNAIESIIL